MNSFIVYTAPDHLFSLSGFPEYFSRNLFKVSIKGQYQTKLNRKAEHTRKYVSILSSTLTP